MESMLIWFGMPILALLSPRFASMVRSTLMKHSISLEEKPGTSVFINTTRLSFSCSVFTSPSSSLIVLIGCGVSLEDGSDCGGDVLKTGTTRFSIASGSRMDFQNAVFHRAKRDVFGAQPSGYRHNAFKLTRLVFELSSNLQSFSFRVEFDGNIVARISRHGKFETDFTFLRWAPRRLMFPDATGIATTGMVIFGTAMRKTPSITAAFAFSMSCVALRLSLISNDEEGNATLKVTEEVGTF